ncbi:DUF6493 family protein [Myxococcus qinghaiensis]|uniref:DUF6493 family protein n=1 Tax=Myxococcus qinghaiensis TaxID=2906758 RepID=UPI0020A7F3C8|nr:DUF6493 family protein [Myxococcus qinghaiensis]MCP3166723.1 DUF6493 family protein [Myxococcus qinghaiensis]
MTTSSLDALLAAPSLAACATLLEGLTPAQRRQLGPEVLERHKVLWHEPWPEAREAQELRRECFRVLAILVFFTVPLSKWKPGILYHLPEETAALAAKLRPDWLDGAAEQLVADDPAYFRVAHMLVREGLSHRPTHDNYITGLLFVDTRFQPHPFDTDPRLLEYEAWRLFEVEGSGELSLAAKDKYTHPEDKTWASAFLRHMRQGSLERGRLLDATLGALERDFAAFRAGWFSRFHERLEPTPEELTRHTDRYLRLLGSSIPATVSLALDVITALEARAPLPVDAVLPALEPVLLARHKGTAQQAVKLLKTLGERESGVSHERITVALASGFVHEAVDVQKAVLKALESLAKTPDAALRAAVEERVEGVAASLKKQVQAWLGERTAPTAAKPPKAPAGKKPSVEPRAPASPTDARFAVTPIANLDELLSVLSACIEDAGNPMDVERVLDGVARLGRQRPDDFARRTSALAKRARKLSAKPYGESLTVRLAGLALAWLAPPGEALSTLRGLPEPVFTPGHEVLLPLLSERISDLARALDAGRDEGLLSTPTHEGGWLAPETLVTRLLARASDADEPPLSDLCLALCRLAPVRDAKALEPLKQSSRSRSSALKLVAWALGLSKSAPAAADVSVSLARRHRGDAPPAEHTFTIKARRSGEYTFHDLAISTTPKPGSPKKLSPQDIPGLMLIKERGGGGKPYPRWAATLWPSGLEAFFASRAEELAMNLDWSEANWSNVVAYEQLLHPWLRLGPMARLVLGMGLATKEPGEHGVSVDAAISALATGRLTAEELGQLMRELRPTGLINLKRWSTTLARVASASEEHAAQVALAIQHALRKTPKDTAPRDEGTLVKLLLELLAQTEGRLTDTEAWDYLQGTPHRKTFEALAPATSSVAPPPPPAARRTTPRRASRRPPPAAR